MESDDIRDEALVYTAKDVETYLSHLTRWYTEERVGEQDVLEDTDEAELDLHRLATARSSIRFNASETKEFSRDDALAMLERLRRKKIVVGDGFLIRPTRLVGAMRAIRARRRNLTRDRIS